MYLPAIQQVKFSKRYFYGPKDEGKLTRLHIGQESAKVIGEPLIKIPMVQ
jgi:hypothetical protein